MGSWDFEADSGKQTTLGESLVTSGDKFISDCENMVTTKIGSEMSAHWEGADYTAFAQGAEGYLPALKDLGNTFKLFGEHFKSMSEGTSGLGDALVQVVDALLEGGAAGSEVGAPGEGMEPETGGEGGEAGGTGASENPNPNSYGGKNFTREEEDGTATYSTDDKGNVVYRKKDFGDRVEETYFGPDGSISKIVTPKGGDSVVTFSKNGQTVKDFDPEVFNPDGTFTDEYMSKHLGGTGSGANEFGGYTLREDFDNKGDYVTSISKYDAQGKPVENTVKNNNTGEESYVGMDRDGNVIKLLRDKNGAITAAVVVPAAAMADKVVNDDDNYINLNIKDGKIDDSRMPDSFDENGNLTEKEAARIKNSGRTSRAMTDEEYADVKEPEEKTGGEGSNPGGKDPETKDAEEEDAGGKDPKTIDAEEEDAGGKDPEAKDAEEEDTGGKDPETIDAEEEDTGGKDSETKDAEEEDTGGKDPKTIDAEEEDTGGKDPETKDAEEEDAEASKSGEGSEDAIKGGDAGEDAAAASKDADAEEEDAGGKDPETIDAEEEDAEKSLEGQLDPENEDAP